MPRNKKTHSVLRNIEIFSDLVGHVNDLYKEKFWNVLAVCKHFIFNFSGLNLQLDYLDLDNTEIKFINFCLEIVCLNLIGVSPLHDSSQQTGACFEDTSVAPAVRWIYRGLVI